MLKYNELPLIKLDEISSDVTACLNDSKVDFKTFKDAPWLIQKFSSIFSESYVAYKNTIYVPEGHVAMAVSKNFQDRIIATSKLLPWVYAIKNGSVSSVYNFLYTMFSVKVRGYYFLFEYAMLKSHEIEELPELITTGFISSRRTCLGFKRDPDYVLASLRETLNSKISNPNA